MWLVNLHKALAEALGSSGTAPDSPLLSSPRLRLPRNSVSDPRPFSALGAAASAQPATAAAKVAGQVRLGNGRGARILIADDDKGQVMEDGLGELS